MINKKLKNKSVVFCKNLKLQCRGGGVIQTTILMTTINMIKKNIKKKKVEMEVTKTQEPMGQLLLEQSLDACWVGRWPSGLLSTSATRKDRQHKSTTLLKLSQCKAYKYKQRTKQTKPATMYAQYAYKTNAMFQSVAVINSIAIVLRSGQRRNQNALYAERRCQNRSADPLNDNNLSEVFYK